MVGVLGASLQPAVSTVPASICRGEPLATPTLGKPLGAVGGPTSAVICIVQYDVMMSGG